MSKDLGLRLFLCLAFVTVQYHEQGETKESAMKKDT